MHQVKIFKNLEYHYDQLEGEINRWIRDNEIDVVDIRVQLSPQSPGAEGSVSSDSDSDLLAYVIYRAN